MVKIATNIQNWLKSKCYYKSEVDTFLKSKSDSTHIHDDRYYTESEIDGKLDNKANSSHNHDSRYYTETEIDSKLTSKMNNDYKTSTILNNFFVHKIGNIAIVSWWNLAGAISLSSANEWNNWKEVPYASAAENSIWCNIEGTNGEVRLRIDSNSKMLKIWSSTTTPNIKAGQFIYPTYG